MLRGDGESGALMGVSYAINGYDEALNGEKKAS